MSEPITVYSRDGKTFTTNAPSEARNFMEAGWTLKPWNSGPPTPIPDDFPAADELRRAGLGTLEDVAKHHDLTRINGIGRATAAKIKAALAGRAEG